jgi:hypothetical protein
MVLVAIGVMLPPFGRLDVSMLVDVEQAPYPSGASRLSARVFCCILFTLACASRRLLQIAIFSLT